MSNNQKIINSLFDLNSNFSNNEILYNTIAFLKINNGLNAIEKGEILTNEEMKEIINQC